MGGTLPKFGGYNTTMSFRQDSKNVTTAGTRVALGTTRLIDSITIKARENNVGRIFVGDNTVSNADPQHGLNPGDVVNASWARGGGGNLADIFIDAATNGDGVVFWYAG